MKDSDRATYIEKLKSALDTAMLMVLQESHFINVNRSKKRLHNVRLLNNQFGIGDLVYVGKCPKLQHVWDGHLLF